MIMEGEFSAHECVSQAVKMSDFFCDPYASWQKSGVENTNGRLRRDMPRDTDIHNMTKGEFDENVLNYNTTPRKSLGNFAMLAGINVKTLQEWHLAVYSDAYK